MRVLDNGNWRDSSVVLAADHLIKLKSTSDVWTVIAECIKVWTNKNPGHWQSYIIDLQGVKETRKNKFAVSHDKVTGGDLRYTIDIPFPLMAMIRKLYTTDELPMDKRFFEVFAKKFPVFQVAERI